MFFNQISLNSGCPGLQKNTVHVSYCKPHTCELAGDPQIHRKQTLFQPIVTLCRTIICTTNTYHAVSPQGEIN